MNRCQLQFLRSCWWNHRQPARPEVREMTLHLTPEISGDLALKIVSEIRHELFTSDHKPMCAVYSLSLAGASKLESDINAAIHERHSSGVKLQVMSTVFAKLNFKDHRQIVALYSPGSFESELAALKSVEIICDLKKAKEITFCLAFVTTQEQLNTFAPAIAQKVRGDAIVWFAYPKGTSKKYKSQIGRDNGWNVLGQEGFEPVRLVAIDEDWSAKRFRRSGFIKNMTRPKEYRLTERGKARPAKVPPG